MNPGANILSDNDNALDVFDEFTVVLGHIDIENVDASYITVHVTASNLGQAVATAVQYVNTGGEVYCLLGDNCWAAAAFYGHIENLID